MPTLVPIHDAGDPRIQAFRDIRERDLVGRQGLFVAEGTVVLDRLAGSTTHQALSLLIADKRVSALEPLWSRFGTDIPLYMAPPAVLDAIAGFPLHRGVLAIGRREKQLEPDALLEDIRHGDVLMLCGIANHDNMGGLFRNAAAFGVRAVLLDADCCDPLYRKAIRVSVGASLTVPWARLSREADALSLLERHGFVPVALSPAGERPLSEWQPDGRHAVLFGAEGPGLAPELLARVQSLRIPMASDFDSLNVATTSGIVLHHLSNSTRRPGNSMAVALP